MNKKIFLFYTKIMNSLDMANQLKKSLLDSTDIIVRDLEINGERVALVFIDELCNVEELNRSVLFPIKQFMTTDITIEDLRKNVSSFCNVEILDLQQAKEKLLRGFSLIFMDGEEKVLVFNTVMYPGRSVEEPPTSTVISGPREGFNETLKVNLSLIRKRLPSSNLKVEELNIGRRTKTRINIVYFDDIVDKDVVNEIKQKLNKFDIDGVIDSYYLMKFLENRPNSIFRQVGNTEKPDIACAKLLEGRVVILVDGTPIAITIPYVMFEDFQSSNDYYSDAHRVSILRIIRVLGLFLSIFLPGMYIALQLYHYKVLPLKFLVTIVNTTQNLPLNPFLEIFFIIILFDILFEASVRMPKYLGMAISIVGALILGDTAVKAGLVSPPGVMIVALSAITVYIIPNQSSQISILRIVFALIGGTLGFHGIILGMLFLIAYLCNFDSFKTPYLAPYAPYISKDMKDFILKDSLTTMKTRPQSIPNKNSTRLRDKGEEKK